MVSLAPLRLAPLGISYPSLPGAPDCFVTLSKCPVAFLLGVEVLLVPLCVRCSRKNCSELVQHIFELSNVSLCTHNFPL